MTRDCAYGLQALEITSIKILVRLMHIESKLANKTKSSTPAMIRSPMQAQIHQAYTLSHIDHSVKPQTTQVKVKDKVESESK